MSTISKIINSATKFTKFTNCLTALHFVSGHHPSSNIKVDLYMLNTDQNYDNCTVFIPAGDKESITYLENLLQHLRTKCKETIISEANNIKDLP